MQDDPKSFALSLFVCAEEQTPVQRSLYAALRRVLDVGCCEFAERAAGATSEPTIRYASVCGLPMQSTPSSSAELAAARAILMELERGTGDEDDCMSLDYPGTLHAIMVYLDASSYGDAQAAAFIAAAHASAAVEVRVRSRPVLIYSRPGSPRPDHHDLLEVEANS